MGKRWVFQELVQKNDDGALDVIGYVAYALYKAKKDSLATSLRKQSKPEEEIERRLREFHENTVLNESECKDLRKRAEQVIDESISSALDDMERTLTLQLESFQASLQSNFDRKTKELSKDREKFEKEKSSLRTRIRKEESNKLHLAAKDATQSHWCVRSLVWLWNGCSGIFATIILGVFIYGGLVFFGDVNLQKTLLSEALKWLSDTLTSNPLPNVQ